jgi:hypothetical protein|tara:strand:+ start:1384 stop:1638 length:255 start_codon:yes stop_codon:yes gene_type:complete
MTNIDQLSDLELLRLKALEDYHYYNDDVIPEDTRLAILNLPPEDLKTYFDMDIEEYRSDLKDRSLDHQDSWIRDQLKEIQTLLD